MDSAIKAFYIAGSTLIALMVLAVLVYMFQNGASLGESYNFREQTLQINQFNSQFDVYAKKVNQINDANYGYSFTEKGNTVFDVVTCANLAMSINEKNDFDKVNCVEVEVLCKDGTLKINSDPAQPKNAFLNGSNEVNFYKFIKDYSDVKIVNINAAKYKVNNETIYKYYFSVENDGIHYSDVTGKIDKITFKLATTEHYDEF